MPHNTMFLSLPLEWLHFYTGSPWWEGWPPAVPAFLELTVSTREKISWSPHPGQAPPPRILPTQFVSLAHPSAAVRRGVEYCDWSARSTCTFLDKPTRITCCAGKVSSKRKEDGIDQKRGTIIIVDLFFLKRLCRSTFMGMEASGDGERLRFHQSSAVPCAGNPPTYHSNPYHVSGLLTTWGG